MKIWKKLTALSLAAVTALSLCACGEKPEEELTGQVYKADLIELKKPSDSNSDDTGIYRVFCTEQGTYGFDSVKIGERELEPGEELCYEGQLDVYGNRLLFVDLAGKVSVLEGYRDMEYTPADGYTGNCSDDCVCQTADGGFLTLTRVEEYKKYEETENGGDDVYMEGNDDYHSRYYLRELDQTGAERSRVLLNMEKLEQVSPYFYLSNMVPLNEKQILVATENASLLVLDRKTGEIVKEYMANGDDTWIQSMVKLRDGRIVVIGATFTPEYRFFAALVNPDNGRLENKADMDSSFDAVSPSFDERYDFCYVSGAKLKGFNLASGKTETILDWINCDINPYQISGVTIREGGVVTGVFADYGADGAEEPYLATLKLVDRSELPKREIVTLACAYNPGLASTIINFNRKHEDVRVELHSYEEYDSSNENTGVTKLKTEIMAGNCPDILLLNGLDFRQLAARGLLADLYPMLDADKELSREDLLPAAARVLENDGKLLRLASCFSLEYAVGLKENIGVRNSWTYSDALKQLKSMPEDCTFWSFTDTRRELLEECLSADADSFVNWQTGEVFFNGDEFISLLKLAKTLPDEFDWDNYEWSDDDYSIGRLLKGKQMVSREFCSNFSDLVNMESNYGALRKLTVVGLPSLSGNGVKMRFDSTFAICEASRHKEAAWQFVRGLLTGEIASEYGEWGFSTNNGKFEQTLENAKTPQYVLDENGNAVIDPETGDKEMIALAWFYDELSDEYTPIYELNKEELSFFDSLMEKAGACGDGNDEIKNIVMGQVEAYFSGQRSAEETARIIQDKVSLYVNENR